MPSVDLQLHVAFKTSSFKFKVIQSDHWGEGSNVTFLGWPQKFLYLLTADIAQWDKVYETLFVCQIAYFQICTEYLIFLSA